MKNIIVIGAGASGMLAAITAAERGASVTVLEGMEKPGKKLLLTGSGRCNLTNLHQSEDCYRGDNRLIKSVLEQFSVDDTLKFFKKIGLLTYDRDGYVYPLTGQASSVLDVLLLEMRRLKVKLKCKEKVVSLEKDADGFHVRTESWTYHADAVILATGSKAAPATGSDGSGYTLAEMCGHLIHTPMEALVPLKIREPWIRKLSGIRMPAAITLDCANTHKQVYQEAGELQWTDYGISGIVVFQLSRYAVRALREKQNVKVCLDLFSSFSEEELYAHIKRRTCAETAGEMLAGVLPSKAIAPLLEQAGIAASVKAATLSEEQLHAIVKAIKHTELHVSGSKSFEQAQACQGGVDCTQMNRKTLESLIMEGLYITGELLDVDGICGGYNLQWAWSSGYAAGYHASEG